MCLATQGRIFWPIFAVVYISFLVWGCHGKGSGATQAPGNRPAQSQIESVPGTRADPDGNDHDLDSETTVGESRPVDANYPEALYR